MAIEEADGWHWTATALGFVISILLLTYQGVFQPKRCPVNYIELKDRLAEAFFRYRVPLQLIRRNWLSMAVIIAVGGAAILSVGSAMGLLSPPNGSKHTTRGVVKWAGLGLFVGFFEELIFRVTLLRRRQPPRENAAGVVQPVTSGRTDAKETPVEVYGVQEGDASTGTPADVPEVQDFDESSGTPPEMPEAQDLDEQAPADIPEALPDAAAEAQTRPQPKAPVRCQRLVRCGDCEGRPHWAEQLLTLGLFALYHLDAFHENHQYREPGFLICMVFLGVVCQELFYRSGTVYPSMIFHGAAVWIWKAFF